MQAHAGLVEDEKRVDERGAEAGGEIDALDLTAGKRLRRAVEREVAKADLFEVAQTGEDGVVGEFRLVVAECGAMSADLGEEINDRQLVEFGQRESLPLPAQRLWLQARAMAGGAGIVRTVAREEDAHVHLVGVFLQPPKKSLNAIPRLGPFESVFAVAGFAINDEGALLGRERGEGNVDGDFFLSRDGAEIVLGRAVDFAFPAFDGAVVDGESLVGNRQTVVDLDDAAEAAALWTGAERGIERE